MAVEEQVLNLFDSYWFESQILIAKKPISTTSKTSSILEPHEQALLVLEQQPKLSRTPTFMVRSVSDQCLSSQDSLVSEISMSHSPKSVLVEPKLKPILSGKEYREDDEDSEPKAVLVDMISTVKKNREGCRRRRKQSTTSKSLSELEFEEVKGFMDLGFVFSDEDNKDSNLVSIIPGLRRLGRENVEESAVSRPHLSEAWDVLEEQKKMKKKIVNPLSNWRINQAFGNDMEMKDQIRFWAHSVASAVR